MSIALSVHPKPSGIFFALMRALCGGVAVLGLAVAMTPGILSGFVKICFLLAACGSAFGSMQYLRLLQARRYSVRVCAAGKVRLQRLAGKNDIGDESAEVTLAPGSVLWPFLLVLRLQNELGKVTPLVILPDSVSGPDFRALSVAFRWIAVR